MRRRFVFKQVSSLVLSVLLGAWSVGQPVGAQVLTPRVPQVDLKALEQQGLSIAQEAAQLAQFEQFDEALPRVELASQLAPQNSQIWALLGSLYLQKDELDKAIAALQRARMLDASNAPVLFALGNAYFQQQRYTQAVEALQAGLKLKANIPGALFDLGNAYYMLKRYS
ncbi:MAG: tetratricopeptide repeat protein, partial [Cyanobacteria bacterium]|nr:tetratricopeptide repeat protein [Cyanobacteriota bacterium]MDW8200548.1 tetratricopeptide repeat protein [Cyanobacteriota bacterium SKYGB_h_bin112]